jgi:hypothetical protein
MDRAMDLWPVVGLWTCEQTTKRWWTLPKQINSEQVHRSECLIGFS